MGADQPVRHPVFARFFDRFAAKDEEHGQAELRDELLRGLTGRVIEVGAGNGLNFPHYPAEVEELVAVEPEAYLRERAVAAARTASVPITVLDGVAGRLPAGEGSFDAAVVSGFLCSVRIKARRWPTCVESFVPEVSCASMSTCERGALCAAASRMRSISCGRA